MSSSTLYLIPTYLDEQALAPLPAYILDAVKTCSVFFVENERSARRFLKTLWKEMVIDQYEWHPIHKLEEDPAVTASFRSALANNSTIGILSEAGCPGIADPGQLLTAIAHETGATVRPLVGPSSILLALMASGLNGQQFKFNGYLPVDNAGRTTAIRNLETESARQNCTQLFIETPYRNNQLLTTLLATCRPSARLCIAANLTGPNEYIRTLPISRWRQLAPPTVDTASPPNPNHLPDLNKQPTIFCLLA
ncbi:MAG TPA: SAM-dependent methyltransferase [Puia sp.]|jgi:16S rRNA (cytidine1402-2'-O)-methyltransferase|nr:SAM-dependent methyltransferase [Puia sp.]